MIAVAAPSGGKPIAATTLPPVASNDPRPADMQCETMRSDWLDAPHSSLRGTHGDSQVTVNALPWPATWAMAPNRPKDSSCTPAVK